MSDDLENLETAVSAILAKKPTPSAEQIRHEINRFRNVYATVDDAAAEALARAMEQRHGVTMLLGSTLKGPEYQPWLKAAHEQGRITPYYWDRYKKLLAMKNFSGHVVATLDDVTNRILDLSGNPLNEGPWDRRGMVVGHVQSGKTANYIGLICKAADAGYKLIVVVAGVHNNLRNQTQLRIDEGFVGRDSSWLLSRKGDRFVGVGKISIERRPITFTNATRDFNKQMATSLGVALQDLNEPVVFVIKKNSSTLKNLIEWLREHSGKGMGKTVHAPMLLIDDEADNASINIKHGKAEVSRINGQLRDLLQIFERSCYIGYTATPFANIFIDPESDDEMLGADLFPRNFIVSLDAPSNYFGPSKVFRDDAEAVVRYIDDNEDSLPIKHTIDIQVGVLPESLLRALRVFVVARAIRLARGHQREHTSMLVNVTRFTNVQGQVRNALHQRLDEIRSSIAIYGALSNTDAPAMVALKEAWRDEFAEQTEFSWPEIQKHLLKAAAAISVVEINSKSAGKLNYSEHKESGLAVIAVGGFSLSRGLTLEGLMVSYFLRNSVMYDTLMQMGRWFGYRTGYDDLCRVWMPEEAAGWYAHIADSIETLRDELKRMEAANATPEEFGLKVRSHPDTLIVTARNKMGSGERIVVKIGLANYFSETHLLRRDQASITRNLEAARAFAAGMEGAGYPPSHAELVERGWLVRAVPVQHVLDFVGSFQNHPGSMLTDSDLVRKYIEPRRHTELAEWDVLFTTLKDAKPDALKDAKPDALVDESMGIRILCQRRTAGTKSDGRTLRITNKQRVSSRGVEKTGLSNAAIEMAEKQHREKEGATDNYPDYIYRHARERPLLIIHLLQVTIPNGVPGPIHEEPIVAWSISFPQTEMEQERVEYIVNTTWLKENFGAELEEDELGGDDS